MVPQIRSQAFNTKFDQKPVLRFSRLLNYTTKYFYCCNLMRKYAGQSFVRNILITIYKYLTSFARDVFRKERSLRLKWFFSPESNHNWNFQRIKIPRYRILWTSIQWFESLKAYSQPVMSNRIGVPPPPPPQKKTYHCQRGKHNTLWNSV